MTVFVLPLGDPLLAVFCRLTFSITCRTRILLVIRLQEWVVNENGSSQVETNMCDFDGIWSD